MTFTNIRYSVLLNDAQYDYLLDKNQGIDRMTCFRTFLNMAVMVRTVVPKKNFSAVLQPGQFMASKVELCKAWQCNRKTATRIVQEFNQMGILQSEASNRTTIHTLKCLAIWLTDQGGVINYFFDTNPMVKPIGKVDINTGHVPPVAEHVPTKNDIPTPSAPAATSVAEGDRKNDAGQPSDASFERKDERLAEPPSPSRLDDAPVGKRGKSCQSKRRKTIATDIKKNKQLLLWNLIEGEEQ